MTRQHTSGPWKVEQIATNRHGYEWPVYTVRSCRENQCLAVVGEVDRATSPDNEANARLIAAAPDLLAALIACQTIINREAPDGHIAYSMRAAIAKATGDNQQ